LRGLITKLRRDVRALSPIFAVLLLIAIAVIAGIIIYMYTSGYLSTMMGGGTTGQDKVAVESVVITGASSVDVYAVSTGVGPVKITGAILRDGAGRTLDTATLLAAVTLPTGVLTKVSVTFPTATLVSGKTYTVSLISEAGGQFVSGSFVAP